MSRFRLVLIGFVCALFAFAAASAHAAFPGANGQIAVTNCEDGANCMQFLVWSMNPDGSGAARLFSSPGFNDDDPSYSADGRWIAFQRCPPGGGATTGCGIAIVDAHGQNLKQLTPLDPLHAQDYPAFSPDGAQIVFERDGDIWVMGADGGNPHQITTGGNDNRPRFSPDGQKIEFERSGILMLMPAGGGTATAIPGSTSQDGSADFSPDGSKLVFGHCSGPQQCRIMETNLDGSERHPLTSPTSTQDDQEPVFSPDGSTVLFERNPDTTGSGCPELLLTVSANGGTPQQLPASGCFFKSSWGRVATPSVDSAPTIGGAAAPRVGHGLTVTPGAANWGGATSFQWFRCAATCTPIGGATGSTYKPTNADKGKTLKVRQTQSDAGGSASGDSAATGKVAGEPGAKIAHKGTVTSKGIALITLSCPKAQSGFCKGKLTLSGSVATAAKKLGSGAFKIRSGKRAKVKVKLTKGARAAFARKGKLKVRATAKSRDDAGNLTTTKAKVALRKH